MRHCNQWHKPNHWGCCSHLFKVTKRVLLATLKLAVTLRAALIVTEQLLLVPVQAPPQPAKLLPDAAWAVNVTCVPAA